MSTSSILSECPKVQRALGELFIEVGQREQLPFLEFLLSPENTKMITTEVSPGRGKLKTVEARWIQRLPESIVEEGADILTCTATEVYGDSTTTYTLDTTDTYQVNQLISADEIARHCQDNNTYIMESIMRLAIALEQKVSSAAATQVVAQIGEWGTEVDDFFTVTADFLQIATQGATATEPNPFALADIQQATRMANYPAAPVAFGGAAMQRYANAVQAGCCTQYGIDLLEISRQNGFAFAYDARLAGALGSQNKNIVTTAGAIQWLSFNLAQWRGMDAQIGSNYAKTLVFSPAGLPIDLTMKDDCGNLSIVMTSTGKIVTLPDDIYESTDKYAGVNYVNGVTVANS
jgi:hypothetical protein